MERSQSEICRRGVQVEVELQWLFCGAGYNLAGEQVVVLKAAASSPGSQWLTRTDPTWSMSARVQPDLFSAS